MIFGFIFSAHCGQTRFQETFFVFHLTPQQAQDIAMSRYVSIKQAQIRYIMDLRATGPGFAPQRLEYTFYLASRRMYLSVTVGQSSGRIRTKTLKRVVMASSVPFHICG